MDGGDEYVLRPVPRRLRRRAHAVTTGACLAFGAVALLVGVTIEGARFRATVWAVVAAMVASAGIGVAWFVRSLSSEDRRVLAAARRRVLEPLPPPAQDPAPGLLVELRPGVVWRRRLTGRPEAWRIGGDARELLVPGWLLVVPPRGRDRADPVRIPWAQITRFRVRAESDGPDVYDIEGRGGDGAPSRWQVRRHEITDEVALLDYVRSVGQVTVELEDSIVARGVAR